MLYLNLITGDFFAVTNQIKKSVLMVMIPGVSGEEDPRTGQRTAVCHEGLKESDIKR